MHRCFHDNFVGHASMDVGFVVLGGIPRAAPVTEDTAPPCASLRERPEAPVGQPSRRRWALVAERWRGGGWDLDGLGWFSGVGSLSIKPCGRRTHLTAHGCRCVSLHNTANNASLHGRIILKSEIPSFQVLSLSHRSKWNVRSPFPRRTK